MLIVTKEIGLLLVSVLKATLVTLMCPVDRSAQLTASVQQQSPAEITNASTHAQVYVGRMLNAES